MDTRYLASFVKIAETGSISRAAVSLGISQPSLSQQLLRLEELVGLPLLRRTARGVSLTEPGRIFLERARNILSDIEKAIEQVRQLGEPSGAITLAVPYSISRLAGVALIEAFAERMPLVSFRLVEAYTGQIRAWLEQDKVGIGVLHGDGPFSNLSTRALASEELFMVGPAGEFGDGPDDLPVVGTDKLPELRLILPGRQHGLRQTIDHTAARLGLALNVGLELDALVHVAALVARGHGYSLLPLPAIADELAAGKISIARVGSGIFRRTLSLVRSTAQLVTHATIRAEDLVASVLGELIAAGTWRAEPADGLCDPVGRHALPQTGER